MGQLNVELMMDDFIDRIQHIVVREWLLRENVLTGVQWMRSVPIGRGRSTPRVHGSGLFTRGQTQALTTVTLGTIPTSRSSTTYITTNLRDICTTTTSRHILERHADCGPGQRDRARSTGWALSRLFQVRQSSCTAYVWYQKLVLKRFNITGINLRMYARSDGRRSSYQHLSPEYPAA